MATTFPDSVQNFPTMTDLTSSDVAAVKGYQQAILANNFTLAAQYLATIANADKKLITADYLNTINDTMEALQTFYLNKWTPAYVVSSTQPSTHEVGDFWVQVVE